PDLPLSETGAAVPEATRVGPARLPAPGQKRRPGLGHRARDHARSRRRGARVPGARTHQHPPSRELNAPVSSRQPISTGAICVNARELKQPMSPTDALEYERYQSARRNMSDAEFRAFKTH